MRSLLNKSILIEDIIVLLLSIFFILGMINLPIYLISTVITILLGLVFTIINSKIEHKENMERLRQREERWAGEDEQRARNRWLEEEIRRQRENNSTMSMAVSGIYVLPEEEKEKPQLKIEIPEEIFKL